ncbi:hypothetical protein IW261DRAFT_1416325 [Armillaria novae-zelandiae]|uniref:Uncharacterized protein n=1 Tax=Armillaria novae-zelandiae TaxID=153914 RepID=A0AA39PLM5_9AGAR|nr:hypothetical protein IW261DRAFT_1416325 [Armillaria novae-zelandiae]
MQRQESVLLTTDYNLFMGIFESSVPYAIASWLLEWNSDSKEEKQSAVPTTVDTLSSAVPHINRIVPIYSHENGDIVGYVTHGDGTPGSIPSAQATHSETNFLEPAKGPEGEKNSHEGNESKLEVGSDFDQEELVKWHRDQLDNQEVERKAQKVTHPKPKMLSHDTAVTMRKWQAPDEIPDKQSVSKSGNIEKDTAPPAKRSHRKSKHDTDPNQ